MTAVLSKGWPYLLALAAIIVAARSCASDAVAQAASKRSAAELVVATDSIAVLQKLAIRDTIVLTKLVTHLDTVLRVRTVVLAKVDSDWAKIAPAIALVPASDSACHKALDAIQTPCAALKAQAVLDGVALRGVRDTIVQVKADQVHAVSIATQATAQLDSVKAAYVCHISFGLFRLGCPSRSLLLGVGAVLGFVGARVIP